MLLLIDFLIKRRHLCTAYIWKNKWKNESSIVTKFCISGAPALLACWNFFKVASKIFGLVQQTAVDISSSQWVKYD